MSASFGQRVGEPPVCAARAYNCPAESTTRLTICAGLFPTPGNRAALGDEGHAHSAWQTGEPHATRVARPRDLCHPAPMAEAAPVVRGPPSVERPSVQAERSNR